MTLFRSRVLRALSHHEYEGHIEVALELCGYPTALEFHNVVKAVDWLITHGYVDASGPTLTDKGKLEIPHGK